MSDSPTIPDTEDYSNCPLYLGFLALLKEGIAAEGQGIEETEERSAELARLPEVGSGNTNTWRAS